MKPDSLEDASHPSVPETAGVLAGPRAVRMAWPAPVALARRGGEETLERAQQTAMRLVAQRAPVLVWTTDREMRVNWGLKHPALSGLDERLSRALGSGAGEGAAVAAHTRALAGEAADFYEAWEGRAVQARVEPVRGPSGEVEGTVAVAVCELDRHERDEMLKAGLHDPQTNLPRRAVFVDRLRRAMAGADWCVEGLFVILVDLDGFADLNHAHGYETADRILAEAAARLQRRLRPSDTVARYGADEFAVLLSGIRDGRDVMRVAQRLQAELSAPFAVQSAEVRMTAGVGIAAGLVGQRPEDLLRDAERALARAKVLGRAGCQVFQHGRDGRETVLANLETALRRTLELGEFRAQYRGTVLRKQGGVAGFDILLWKRGEAVPAAPPKPAPPPPQGAAPPAST